MTTVRRITTNKIDGDDANNNSSSEIRPRGEIGIYENTDNGNLELLMFDGVRQNIRSKILSKGIFYGGNADSGDGEGRDTIKLIPDTVLYRGNDGGEGGNYGNHQHIVIDPLQAQGINDPDQIHIRAGGTINQSTADLFLGGEQQNVRVSDVSDRVSITTDLQHTWTFDANGNLTLPTGGDILDSGGNSVLGGSSANPNIWVQTFESENGVPTDAVVIANSVEYDPDGNIIALFQHVNTVDDTTYYSVGRFTPSGVKLWSARFSDEFNTDGWGLATFDGAIYVAGQTDPDGSGPAYKVSTLNKISEFDGSVEWSRSYDFGYNSASAVVDVSDGNPVMVGFVDDGSDAFIVTTKVDSTNGNVIWSKKLSGQGDEFAYGMAVGPDGEVVVVGWMDQLGTNDAATALYAEPSSNVNWTDSFGGAAGNLSFNVSFTNGVPTFTGIVDPVGNRQVGDTVITVPGSTMGGADGVDDMVVKIGAISGPASADNRMIVVKYNSSGAIQWQKAVQFDEGFDCYGADADIDSDGNIYVVGQYELPIGPSTTNALSIVRFDPSGTKQWSRRVEGGCEAAGTSVVVGPDNKLYISGVTLPAPNGKYIWVAAKYNFDGTVEWQRLIEHTDRWSFVGGNFLDAGGGSNIAVKEGYVVLSGGFGNPINMEIPTATLVQLSSNGDVFSVGDWTISPANFSGTLNNEASDILVVNAGKVNTDITSNITPITVVLTTEVSDFLLGTLYSTTTNNKLINGANELVLQTSGVVTLPQGGTISEGVVTSNPTIQLKPASPQVSSQKLVIKGGSQYVFTENNIELSYQDNTAQVGDILTFFVNSSVYTNQPVYWWIYPEGAGIGDSESGSLTLNENGFGQFTILIDSDDYEFTVRVSPENDNYDPANVGVESGLINADAPTFDSEYHLHLTTGNLGETSIFLGTDNHNVRTTTDGSIKITTAGSPNNVWEFDSTGALTLPGGSNGRIAESEPGVVVFSDSGFAVVAGANVPVSNYQVQFTGYIDSGVDANASGATLHVTAIIAGTITDGMIIYGAGLPPEGWELTFTSSVEPIGSGGIGTYELPGANFLIASQSFNNGVASNIGPKNWIFAPNGNLQFPDGTTQTTAYRNTTTTRPTTSGIPNGFSLITANPSNLTPGNYPNLLIGFDGKNLTLDITIDEFYNISTLNIRNVDPATFVVSDSAVLNGEFFGGTTPADNITITVTSLVPVAIDLTKTINKLTDGEYSLANGVEGQIMYLVAQDATVPGNVSVLVANSRIAGTFTENAQLLPFRIYEHSGDGFYEGTGLCTLIFTDGAWQQTGGAWD